MKKLLFLILFFLTHFTYAQEDCQTAIAVCCGSSITYTPSGIGQQNETLGGCLSTEHHSVWYKFTIDTGGTLTFVITPTGNVDYDWALYGPNVTCGTRGTPIRCSYAAPGGQYLTGLSMTATDLSEGAGGDGFVRYLDVNPGETYYLYVDNFSSTVYTFNLVWGGTASISSAFNNPQLQPFPFVPPGTPAANPNNPREILICNANTVFDFSTLTAGIINGNPNFQVSYHTSASDATTGANPITTPIAVNTTTTYYYSIHYQDPNDPNNALNSCRQSGTFKFVIGNIVVNNDTISTCEINQSGQGIFDLTTANVYTPTGAPYEIRYYPNMANAQAETNEITNATNFQSAPGQVIAKVKRTDIGCVNFAAVNLTFRTPLPVIITNPVVEICDENMDGIIPVNFQDHNNQFTNDPGVTVSYYLTQADAYNQTNPLTTDNAAPKTYFVRLDKAGECTNFAQLTTAIKTPIALNSYLISESICDDDLDGIQTVDITAYTDGFTGGDPTITASYYNSLNDAYNQVNPLGPNQIVNLNKTFFVRLDKAGECPNYAQLVITISIPKFSETLQDKIICIENKTTLDAGPDFDAYLWSTGETTQTISNVGVGTYWVTLTKGLCSYTQEVQVLSSPKPVITAIDINNNDVTVHVTGGTAPYQYSIDNINWQDSNQFTNLPRGQNTIYVRDAYNCEPVEHEITIVNIVNVITPNGDGINDEVDYSALQYKENLEFVVFDRYGNKIHSANKSNGYKWDGRFGGRKVSTGTYWYVFTYNEPDEKKTPVKLSGWIIVKNRE